MKVSELIEQLQTRLERHGDIEVEITWEGITRKIFPETIYYVPLNPWDKYRPVLFIDADGNSHKDGWADPDEPCRNSFGAYPGDEDD